MNKHKLAAGTKYKNSVIGHRNFVYPGDVQDTLIEEVNATTTHFVGGGELSAVAVPEHAVKHNGSPEKQVIIWVEKKEIL